MLEDIMYADEMKYTKCKTCLYRKNFGIQKILEPCSHCTDRPDRKEDKSEYMEELTDNELQENHANERQGIYDY